MQCLTERTWLAPVPTQHKLQTGMKLLGTVPRPSKGSIGKRQQLARLLVTNLALQNTEI